MPSRQVQVVQSLDGGIVKEILVHPGEHVEKGQVILRIDPTRYGSSLGENKAELLALESQGKRGCRHWHRASLSRHQRMCR